MTRLRDIIRREPSGGLSIPPWLDRLLSVGIVSTDPQVVRRQRCVNVAAYAGAVSGLSYIVLTSLYDRQVSMYRTILDTGSALRAFALTGDSLTVARNLVALEDAYGYRIVARHPTLTPTAAAELILAYARQATSNPLQVPA